MDDIQFIQQNVTTIADAARETEHAALQRFIALMDDSLANEASKSLKVVYHKMLKNYVEHMKLTYGGILLKMADDDTEFMSAFLDVDADFVARMLENQPENLELTKHNAGMTAFVKEYAWNESLCKFAVVYDKVRILKWLCDNDCPFTQQCVSKAAELGRMTILEWMYKQASYGYTRFNFAPSAMAGASAGGKLAVMEWLHRKNVCMDFQTTKQAALKGNLDILKFVHKHGGLEHKVARNNASNHPHVLAWLDKIEQ